MKAQGTLLPLLAALGACMITLSTAAAADYYWNTTTTGTWATGANWSDNATSGGTTGTVPGASDTATFHQTTVNGNTIVGFDGSADIGGLTFRNTGTTLLRSNSATPRLLTIGSGGITINSGTGAVTLGNATNILNLRLAGAQNWTNNAGTLFTVVNAVDNDGNDLTIGGNGNTTIRGVLGGSGTLTKNGTGTLTLGSINTLSGATTINAGTLIVTAGTAGGSAVWGSGDIAIGQGSTLFFNPAAQAVQNTAGFSVTGAITLTGGAGTSNLHFAGNDNKFVLSGGITGEAGVAQTLAIRQGNLSPNNGDRMTTQFTGAIADGAGGSLGVSIDFFGSSGVGQRSYTNLAGENTFTGDLTITNSRGMNGGGTHPGAWVTIGGLRHDSFNVGTLVQQGTGFLGAGADYSGNISISNGSGGLTTLSFLTSANQILRGVISGTGSLHQQGSGTLTLTNANTFSGTTTVVTGAGALILDNNLALQNSALVTTGGGFLNLGAGVTTPTIGGLSGASGNLATIISSGYSNVTALTLNPQAGVSVTYGGAIANGASGMTLTKTGAGTQILTGTVNYTGNTNVNEGTLVLRRTTSYVSPTTIVNPGGILELNSTNTTVDNWRINTILAGNGTINVTGSGWIQTFTNAHTFAGTVNIQDTATFGASFLNSNWTGVTADFNVSSDALLDVRGQAITIGGLNGSGRVGTTWTSAATLNLGAGDKSGTFSGAILGSGGGGTNNLANPSGGSLSLVKIGTGTQTLTGVSTYNGTTTINAGTLAVTGAGRINSTSGISIAEDATFRYAPDANHTFNRTITGDGTFRIQHASGNNLAMQSNLSGFSGQVIFESGAGFIRPNATFSSSTARLHLDAGAEMVFDGNQTWGEFSGEAGSRIQSTGGFGRTLTFGHLNTDATVGSNITIQLTLIKEGSGTQTFTTTSNASNAPITINGGTIEIGGAGLFNSGNFTGTIALTNATSTFRYNSTADQTLGGVISGNGMLTQSGSGTLTLSQANTFTGDVTVSAGTLRGSNVNAFGAASNTRTITVENGATLEFNRNGMYGGHASTTVPNIVINGGTVTNVLANSNNPLNNLTLNGGTLTTNVDQSAAWRSWNINGSITSTGTSTISGTTTNAGIMLSSVTPNSNIDVQSGTLTISTTVVNGRGPSSPFNEIATSLTKLGTGTLTLTSGNTYSGGTTVAAGTLLVNNSSGSGTGTGSVTVLSGATLGGNGFISGPTLINSGGILSPGNSGGTISFGSSLGLDPGAVFFVDILFGGSDTDLAQVAGGVSIGGAILDGTWGGGSDNLFRGTYSTDNMFWLINTLDENEDIDGRFANTTAAPGLAHLFGNVTTPDIVSIDGQMFAAFYESQFGVVGPAGLTGGNDFLLIAIPEPSRAMLAAIGLLALLARRRR